MELRRVGVSHQALETERAVYAAPPTASSVFSTAIMSDWVAIVSQISTELAVALSGEKGVVDRRVGGGLLSHQGVPFHCHLPDQRVLVLVAILLQGQVAVLLQLRGRPTDQRASNADHHTRYRSMRLLDAGRGSRWLESIRSRA